AEQLCRFEASVAGDDLIVSINQDGVTESEPGDAVGNVLDLRGRVGPGIGRVWLEPTDRHGLDFVARGRLLLYAINACGGARRTRAVSLIRLNCNFHFIPFLLWVSGTIPTNARRGNINKNNRLHCTQLR